MKEKASKFSLNTPLPIILFIVLFGIGVFIGGYFVWAKDFSLHLLPNSSFCSAIFFEISEDWYAAFSVFLFDFLFFLLVVFLFGMTFLGVAVIPITVLTKGIFIGMSMSAFLLLNGDKAFLRSWITYLPASALSTVVFLFFSTRAFSVSLKTCRFLLQQESMSISLKSYGFQFFIALIILLAASAVNCILGFLAAILF